MGTQTPERVAVEGVPVRSGCGVCMWSVRAVHREGIYGGVRKGWVCLRWRDCTLQEGSFPVWALSVGALRGWGRMRQSGEPARLLGSITPGLHLPVMGNCHRRAGDKGWRKRDFLGKSYSLLCFVPGWASYSPTAPCFWLSYAWFIPLAWMTTISTANFLCNYTSEWCSRGARGGLRFKVPPGGAAVHTLSTDWCSSTKWMWPVLPLQHVLHCRILFSFALDEIKIMLNRRRKRKTYTHAWEESIN